MPLPSTWKELVADALRDLGGEASLHDITEAVETDPRRPHTATWQATIRRVVRQYRIFEPVKTKSGRAGYRLASLPIFPPNNEDAKIDSHGKQQGMLLHLGQFCGFETFTNSSDKTIRTFAGEPISKYATVKNDDEALNSLPMPKVRTADVIWMAEDSEGLYPRYAFEIENSTKVRSGLLRLLRIPERFHTKLFIIGPGREEAALFKRYLSESPFRQHVQRFKFFSYPDVESFYNHGLNFQKNTESWGINPLGR